MIRIAQKDGSFIKISRRKKRKTTGRKRGRPRKKHVLPPLKPSRKRPYSIILTSTNKQKECIKTFRTEEEAYQYFYGMLEENKNVVFPIKYLNRNGIIEAKYELYILKKIDEYTVKDTAILRNEYGELVEHDTNMDNYQIIDKHIWYIEETFWVNGFDPIYQRKTFDWIFDNFIKENNNPYAFKNVLVYQNKLIIDDTDNINIVFCKCVSDSYRLYTEIENKCYANKIKHIMFSGDIRHFSRKTISNWIDKLCEVTGFSRLKIKRNSLRP